jgi:hypothetical protein
MERTGDGIFMSRWQRPDGNPLQRTMSLQSRLRP